MEKQLEEEIQRRMKEQNLQRREFEEEEALRRYRIKERAYMESRLSKYLPLLLECNLIAKEL